MKRLEPLLPFVGIAVLLLVWSLTVWARVVDPVLLPSPFATFRAMWVGMTSGKLGLDFVKTVERTIYSTAIAAVIAIPLGILLGSSEKVYRSVEFLIDFFRSTPASAMFPLFLVLFGVGDKANAMMIGALAQHLPAGDYKFAFGPREFAPTQVAIAWGLGAYAFDRYKKRKRPAPRLVLPDGADRAEAERVVRAAWLARDLVNTPTNDMGPEALHAAAEGVDIGGR